MPATPCSRYLLSLLLLTTAPVSAQGWDGPYVGVHLGAGSANFSNRTVAAPGPSGNDTGAVGGLQLGYNWQAGNAVLGAEADLSFADIGDRFAGGTFDEDVMTSLRLRAGVAQGDTLFFGSVGVAWTEHDSTLTGIGSGTDFAPGVMLGAGAERYLWGNVSGRVEAYYLDAPAEVENIGGTPVEHASRNVIFRAGLSLHF